MPASDNLTDRDAIRLTTILGSCPEIRTAAERGRSFADLDAVTAGLSPPFRRHKI